MLKWLKTWCVKKEQGEEIVSFSARSLRMVEPLRLETTPEQHLDLLKAVGTTKRTKAELIRAALTLALPSLVSNPTMIDILQPGVQQDHDGSASGQDGDVNCPGRPANGRG